MVISAHCHLTSRLKRSSLQHFYTHKSTDESDVLIKLTTLAIYVICPLAIADNIVLIQKLHNYVRLIIIKLYLVLYSMIQWGISTVQTHLIYAQHTSYDIVLLNIIKSDYKILFGHPDTISMRSIV